jgi:serine/threonine protein kinase/CheY-like chemotaxis protein
VKILVVEDDVEIRKNLERMLRMENFDVLIAENGAVAIPLARKHLPALIVSDVMMPVLDGFGFLEQLRADPLIAGIPVIFLTALADRVDMRRAMNLGADDYLTKPFSQEDLLAAINARIKRHGQSDSSSGSFALEANASFAASAAGGDTLKLRDLAAPAPVSIKGYRMLRKIGSGGMSEVFLAVREADGLELVLKVLDTGINQDAALLHRFIQEYSLLSQINHPNVVKIYEQGFTDEHVYLAMEYFPVGDIKRRMAGGFRENEALGVVVQVARALVEIHALGIVHRDVKPDNLMLRADGSIALVDFGIAKHCDIDFGHTLHGEIVGTPSYLSPEQAMGRAVSDATDIYSLGVIFFEMLTGARPYTADKLEALIAQHLFSPAPRLEERFAAYQELLDLMMAKEPSQRFESARAVVDFISSRWPAAIASSCERRQVLRPDTSGA